MRRRGNNILELAASKAGLLLDQRDFRHFAFEHKRDENTFAPASFVGGQFGQTIAAVDQLFDRDLHLGIVRGALDVQT